MTVINLEFMTVIYLEVLVIYLLVIYLWATLRLAVSVVMPWHCAPPADLGVLALKRLVADVLAVATPYRTLAWLENVRNC